MRLSLASFVARRLVAAVAFIVVVSTSALVLTRLAPGDATTEAKLAGADASTIAEMRLRLGLDRPIAAQVESWVLGLVRLDFGTSSLFSGRPVSALVGQAAANTAMLASIALVAATLVGLPIGLMTGARPHGWLSAVVTPVSIALVACPPLVGALALILIAVATGWLSISPGHVVVPALALALPLAATLERVQSQATSDALSSPDLTATAARGVSPRRLLWVHASRQALRPVLGIYGIVIGSLFSGSLAVEAVTGWPGIGRLMYDGLRGRDLFLVAGCALFGAACLALGNLIADIARALVDPRVRERGMTSDVAGGAGRSAFWLRRAGGWGILVISLFALAAGVIAPNRPGDQFPDRAYAPPTRVHIRDAAGFRAPFVYRQVLEDRLMRRYSEDTRVTVPLEWLSRGRLLTVDADRGPLLLLGADALGRDVFSRLVYGAQLSLGVTLCGALGALALGALVGSLAGTLGGRAETLLMLAADFVLVLPGVYLVLVLRAALPLLLSTSQVFWLMASLFTASGWPHVARGVRAIVAAERTREYAEAARAAGAGPLRLIGHLLPAARAFLSIETVLLIPALLVAEATISYLGLGFPEPEPSWGTMLADAANVTVMREAPWILAPAAALFLFVLSVQLAGGTRASANALLTGSRRRSAAAISFRS